MKLYRYFRLKKYGEPLPWVKKETSPIKTKEISPVKEDLPIVAEQHESSSECSEDEKVTSKEGCENFIEEIVEYDLIFKILIEEHKKMQQREMKEKTNNGNVKK